MSASQQTAYGDLSGVRQDPDLHQFPSKVILSSQLLESLTATFTACLDIVRRKNHDYASPENEYSNFESARRIGITVQQSIMVRLQDKIARLENLLNKDGYVTEETFEDTCADAINYLGILTARREYERSL